MERSIEKELLLWKDSRLRMPLILRGARQVGKTYTIEKFGKNHFPSFVSVNFESRPEAIACFDSLDPEAILMRLQAIIQMPIIPGQTLLFLDEIQACPKAISALRYFKEQLPALHVIGAGSLLEFALIRGKFSFPVGRLQFMYLKPLSFQEYVVARGKLDLDRELEDCSLASPPSEAAHQNAIKLVQEFFLVGGMPAAVSVFCDHFSLQEANQIQDILLSTYKADFSKYATEAEQSYLRIVFDRFFQTIGQQFKYSKIDPDIRSRELKQALDHLGWAGLLHFIYASSAAGIPLMAQTKQSQFKLVALDIGLAQRALKIDPETVWKGELVQINKGAMAEQFVGQELLAYADSKEESALFYWKREKKQTDAEIDYVISTGNRIVPIEVKAGSQGKLKSLRQFMEEKKSSLGVHVAQHPLSLNGNVLSVPLYLIHKLPQLVKRFFQSRVA